MLWMLCAACGGEVGMASGPLVATETPVAVADEPLPRESLYTLDIPLIDQDGRELAFDVHRGHRVVVAMFYATCEHTCPVLIRRIQDVEDALDEATRENTRFLLISFAQDAPETLTEVVNQHGLDTTRWTLARTAPAKVRELAMLLDVSYRANPSGGYNHSSGFSALNEHGVVSARLPDMNADPGPVLAVLRAGIEPSQ